MRPGATTGWSQSGAAKPPQTTKYAAASNRSYHSKPTMHPKAPIHTTAYARNQTSVARFAAFSRGASQQAALGAGARGTRRSRTARPATIAPRIATMVRATGGTSRAGINATQIAETPGHTGCNLQGAVDLLRLCGKI